ncbi:hypothetical protein [Bacillus paranthracis]|uniref:hypothetical protein n=1 Tax=Bacillus paranthracis TaxID=2026186 RepID=UPI002D78E11A|nr:hypothetical protein [Bacillus paranthracis]
MNAQSLKEYLIEDIGRIKKVLEAVGVHRIWETGSELRGAPSDSENHTAISVDVNTLFCRYYKRDETFRGDILELIKLLRDESFSDSFKFVKSLFGLGGKFVKENKIDPLAKFKGIRKQHKPITNLDDVEVPKFGMEALSDFIMIPHINLFYEGIMPQTAELFKVCYDPKLDRILFPHFNYNDKNAIVGITGRTTRSKEEIDQFLIPKYWNYISGYKKMYNLYGLAHALEFVKKYGMLVIFEAEKSVLKNFTQTRNEGYSCSVGGHEISDVQVQMLMRLLPTDVEVVIAFDSDVMRMTDKKTGEHIGEKYLIRQAQKFSKYRKASYIYDENNLLGDFESPIDRGYKVFHELLESRKIV